MNTKKDGKPLAVQKENAEDQKEKAKANTFALLWKLISADYFIILNPFLFLSPFILVRDGDP